MIKVENLNVSYMTGSGLLRRKNEIRAVENVSLSVPPGRTVGLVGESGCGKSTLGRAILRLQKERSGSVFFGDTDITQLSEKELLPFRKKMQIVFQDPYSSLNPRLNIFETVSEGLAVHENLSRSEVMDRVLDILARTGIDQESIYRYPHEFSGGQRQRIAIARSLILNPEFVVCDEAVSALDVSTQAQVVNLLIDLKKDNGLSYLFISHDLNIVKYISDDIAVMYLGKIVELAPRENIVSRPAHPYTRALFDSVFDLYDRHKNRNIISGEIPSIVNKPVGCHFHSRCPRADEKCKQEAPGWREIAAGHFTACHYPD